MKVRKRKEKNKRDEKKGRKMERVQGEEKKMIKSLKNAVVRKRKRRKK